MSANLVLRLAMTNTNPLIRAHAEATQRLLRDPDAGFILDIDEAKRVFVLSKER